MVKECKHTMQVLKEGTYHGGCKDIPKHKKPGECYKDGMVEWYTLICTKCFLCSTAERRYVRDEMYYKLKEKLKKYEKASKG